MSKVFVLNTNKQPLNPIHPSRARILLSQGKAAVSNVNNFEWLAKIILVDESQKQWSELRLFFGENFEFESR